MEKYDRVMMATAFIWAEESFCTRAKVGAILSNDGRIVSNGYNGTVSGAGNCCETDCNICNGTGKVAGYEERVCERCQGKGLISKLSVVHAEANAILFASKNGIKTEGCTMYVTLAPCIECSKMMLQAGIKRVIYNTDYKAPEGINFLRENGMIVQKFSKLEENESIRQYTKEHY